MGIRVKCPNPQCGKTLELASNQTGDIVKCPACQQRFQLLPDHIWRQVATPAVPSSPVPRPSPPDPLIGQRIAHYQIESLLGEGGMGKVYKARNTRLDKTCALKILPPELARQDPTLLERFIREARSAAAVEHPNVLRVYFIGRVEQNCFIEMQYVDGGNLQDLLDQRRKLDVRTAARVVRDVANALQAAHEKGIIHRDIKPSNVMLSKKGQVLVADFGLAKMGTAKTKLTQDGYVLGTPLYMSPEQAIGQAVDHRSDIYSLGVMFYEMLAGSPPYTADSPLVVLRMHESAPIPDVTGLAPETPHEIAAMIWKMLAKRPDDRYQNCAEIARELRTFLSAPSPPPVAPHPAGQAPVLLPVERRTVAPRGFSFETERRDRVRPMVVAIISFGIIIGLGLFLFAIIQEPSRTAEPQRAERTETVKTQMSPGAEEFQSRREAQAPRALAVAPLPKPEIPTLPPALPSAGKEPFPPIPETPVAQPPRALPTKESTERPAQPRLLGATSRSATPSAGEAGPAVPQGWTSETKRVKVATPEGEQEKKVTYYTNSIGMKLILIPPGEFIMGSPDGEEGRNNDESPQHKVRISKPFYMGAYEVAQGQYEQLIGESPAKFKAPDNPVEYVSWENALEFCNRLSQKEGVEYRLPTEAEWEYVCKAGSSTPFYTGETIATAQANYDGKYTFGKGLAGERRQKTTPVGSFPPNGFGLYDMYGNVAEWCLDWYDETYYSKAPADEPKGPASGAYRVLRSGSFAVKPTRMRSAARGMMPPSEKNEYVGFRVAVSAQEAAGAAKAPSAPTTPPSNLGKFSGSIKAVDVDGKKISCLVKEGNQEKELTMAVADDSKITLNGNGVKLADLKAGDEVECEWAKKDDAMITNAIAAMRGGRTGGGGTLRGRSVRENLGQFRKDFQEFNPGSDTTYNWLESINEGLEAMKEQKSPGLFYFYSPADKSTAFLYETQIFPQFSRLGAKFVTVKINSQDEKALAPFQKYKGRTCVAFLDPRGKLVQTVSIPNPMTFRSTAAALESKYAR